MAKALKKRFKYWRNKAAEPEDVSHHFQGKRCISECELYIHRPELLKAITLEWLTRNPGIRAIGAIADELDIHTRQPLREAINTLHIEGLVTISKTHDLLAVGWHRAASISPSAWLKCARFEQDNERSK